MEILDIVNESDEVVGRAGRDEVFANKLPRRIVHLFVRNAKNEIALQLRSRNKSFTPLHWVTSASGHVQAGESYDDAVRRECLEETGVDLQPAFLRKDKFTSPSGIMFLATYIATFEGPFNWDTNEVERIQFFDIPTIYEMIDTGEKFHPELLFLLDQHDFRTS